MPPSIIQNPGGHALGKKPLDSLTDEDDYESEGEDENLIEIPINEFSIIPDIEYVSKQLLQKLLDQELVDQDYVKRVLRDYAQKQNDIATKYNGKKLLSSQAQKLRREAALFLYLSILDDYPDLLVKLPRGKEGQGFEWADEILPNYKTEIPNRVVDYTIPSIRDAPPEPPKEEPKKKFVYKKPPKEEPKEEPKKKFVYKKPPKEEPKKEVVAPPPEPYKSDYIRVAPNVWDPEAAFARMKRQGMSSWDNLLAMNDAVRGY